MQRGRVLGDYELLDELGRGAMGVVHRARERSTGALRAVKVLEGTLDPETVARFAREREALARLGGAGVVAIHQSGSAPGCVFFAMDLMPGGTLADRLRERGRLPWREACTIAAKIGRTLGVAAALGLVHRDLKPANVLFDERGEPRVADFGLVRDLAASRLTETGTLVGTPAYMPPEQLAGRGTDARSDVFALGAILHELVLGARPFEGSTLVELARALQSTRPAAPSERGLGPKELDAILARALAADPSRRFADGGAFAAALEPLLAGEKAGGAPSRAALAGAGAVLLVAGGVAVLAASRRTPPPPPSMRPVAAVASRDPVRTSVRSARLSAADERTLVAKIRSGEVLGGLEAAAQVVPAGAPVGPYLDAARERIREVVDKTALGRLTDADVILAVQIFDGMRRLDASVPPPDELLELVTAGWQSIDTLTDAAGVRALVTIAEIVSGPRPGLPKRASLALARGHTGVPLAEARALADRLARRLPRSPWPRLAIGALLVEGDDGAPRDTAGARKHLEAALALASDAEPLNGPDRDLVHETIARSYLVDGDLGATRAQLGLSAGNAGATAYVFTLRAALQPDHDQLRGMLEYGVKAFRLQLEQASDREKVALRAELAVLEPLLERAKAATTEDDWKALEADLRR